jgi:dolichol-phosphate mannosyltransferase
MPVIDGLVMSSPYDVASEPRLSIVLGTLNEHENLPVLLEQIARQRLPPFEVIVVDDGSTDGTREFLRTAAAQSPWLHPIFHDGQQTLTPAQCQGIAEARGEYVLIMDADLQHPPDSIPTMVAELEAGGDLVVATRYGRGGSVGRRSIFRAALSRGAEAVVRAFVPAARRVSDPVSGFFAFRRAIFRPLDARYRGYKLILFLLVSCRARRVVEVPYRFRARKNGSSKIIQDLEFVRTFLREVHRARRLGARPVRVPGNPPVSGRPVRGDTAGILMR